MVEVENVQLEMEEGEWSDEEVADEIAEQGSPEAKRVKSGADEPGCIKLVDYRESDGDEAAGSEDDEPPEEMLNEMARKIAEAKADESKEPKDPKLCAMCQKEVHKYRCPKCNMRTCCVTCSKEHKDKYNCDGVRGPFQPVQKLSQFTASKSIEDQHFLEKISSNINFSPPSAKKQKMENIQPESLEDASKSPSARLIEGVRYAPNSGRERYLMEAAVARHIFFAFDSESKAVNKSEQSTLQEQPKEKEADNEEEGAGKNIDMDSHINFYSQNIFWKLEIVFRRPNSEENSYSDYSKLVHNIPDSIHVATILRQFLKPRPYGCIVSASDLDLQVLQPFIEKGIDNLNIFMPVPKDSKHRYYAIDGEKTLLENVRKRFIVEHPTFVVTFQDECIDMQIASAEEITEINGRLIEDKKMTLNGSNQSGLPGFNRGRGRGRGFQQRGRGNGDNRRGGFRGRGFNGPPRGRGNGDFHRKRQWNDR